MVRLLFRSALIALVLAGMIFGVAAAGDQVSSGPVAEVKEPVFDFGSVYAGKDIIHAFEIRNTGDAPLIIQEVKTG